MVYIKLKRAGSIAAILQKYCTAFIERDFSLLVFLG